MLATDKFIYIHQPKTGGTFVHDVLFKVYGIDWKWYHGVLFFLKKHVDYTTKYGRVHVGGAKHDACSDVDVKWLANRPFLSNIRNPLDQYVSQYEFGWWKRKEYLQYYKAMPEFETKFPKFPELSFEEFMELEYLAYAIGADKVGFYEKGGLGLQSQRFLRYFSKTPDQVIEDAVSGTWSRNDIQDCLFPIHFLRTHALNADLAEYLLSIGFSETDVEFIRDKDRVLPLGKGRTKEQKWQKYYSQDLFDNILSTDKLLFDLFPEFVPK